MVGAASRPCTSNAVTAKCRKEINSMFEPRRLHSGSTVCMSDAMSDAHTALLLTSSCVSIFNGIFHREYFYGTRITDRGVRGMRQTDGGRQRELHSYKLSTMNVLLRAADSSSVACARAAPLRNGFRPKLLRCPRRHPYPRQLVRWRLRICLSAACVILLFPSFLTPLLFFSWLLHPLRLSYS
jgi:hypothetical protein